MCVIQTGLNRYQDFLDCGLLYELRGQTFSRKYLLCKETNGIS
jgi:hypothetical protein